MQPLNHSAQTLQDGGSGAFYLLSFSSLSPTRFGFGILP